MLIQSPRPSIARPHHSYFFCFFLLFTCTVCLCSQPTQAAIDTRSLPVCANGDAQVLTDSFGAFSTGNGLYRFSTECTWLLRPPLNSSETSVFVDFAFSDTETCCDFVRVYAGSNAQSGTLLGTLAGQVSHALFNNTGPMFVVFQSDATLW